MARAATKKAMKPLGDTEYMLEQWGLWRMTGMGVPRYVSPSLIIMRDNVEQICSVSYCITDELAMMVDSCVAKLIKREEGRTGGQIGMGDCVWLYFGAKWPAMRVGRHYGIGEAKARELIKAGVAWIDGRLELLIEAA